MLGIQCSKGAGSLYSAAILGTMVGKKFLSLLGQVSGPPQSNCMLCDYDNKVGSSVDTAQTQELSVYLYTGRLAW